MASNCAFCGRALDPDRWDYVCSTCYMAHDEIRAYEYCPACGQFDSNDLEFGGMDTCLHCKCGYLQCADDLTKHKGAYFHQGNGYRYVKEV